MTTVKSRVLFVCLGNICRSPTAEGVFRTLVQRSGLQDHIEIDSAGTGAWHIGEPPDARAREAAARRGYDLSRLRARQVVAPDDFVQFDHVLAMDHNNLLDLHRQCPEHLKERVRLFMTHAAAFDQNEVPDPYFGGESGFEQVLDMIENASEGLLAYLRSRHGF